MFLMHTLYNTALGWNKITVFLLGRSKEAQEAQLNVSYVIVKYNTIINQQF